MPKIPFFVDGSYESKSRMMAGERTVNLIVENISQGGKAPQGLYRAPGLSTFATGNDGGRGLFAEESGRLFAGQGNKAVEFSSAGVRTERATILVDTNPVQFAANGNDELLIVSGGRGDLMNLTTNVVTANVVANVSQCGMLDTFLLALDPDTGTLKMSESGDGLTWDPAQVLQRGSAPDPWKAMLVSRRDIYLFGRETGDVYYDAGSAPIPFEQRGGAFFEVGIEAPFSLTKFGATLAWLGHSQLGGTKVYMMNGYSPVPISTEAVEWAIEQYKLAGTPVDDAIGWSFEPPGHAFYVLEFPSARHTWMYDRLTNKWTELGYWDPNVNDFTPYRARFHADCFNRTLCCDSQSGKILQLDATVYTDVDGAPLRWLRRLPHLVDEHRQFSLSYLELECARGVGLVAGQGVDPQIMCRVSWDGGNIYSDERSESMGLRGQYGHKVRWDRWGTGEDLVVEFSGSDPVPIFMSDLYAGLT